MDDIANKIDFKVGRTSLDNTGVSTEEQAYLTKLTKQQDKEKAAKSKGKGKGTGKGKTKEKGKVKDKGKGKGKRKNAIGINKTTDRQTYRN